MRLKPTTRVNSVLLHKKNSNELIGSCDLNMTFAEYNNRASGKTQCMYGLNYKLHKVHRSQGYTFKLYVCETESIIAQFIELSR